MFFEVYLYETQYKHNLVVPAYAVQLVFAKQQAVGILIDCSLSYLKQMNVACQIRIIAVLNRFLTCHT